jgi:EAL and modified HD-GYP domain-containing signal transduction protein
VTDAILHRTPVVTRNQELAGYRFQLLSSHGEAAASGGLGALLASRDGKPSFFEQLPKRFALVDCAQVETESPGSASARFVLGLQADGTVDLAALAKKCKSAGFGICVTDPHADGMPPALLDQAGYFRSSVEQPNGMLVKTSQRLRHHRAKQIAASLATRAAFDAALRACLDLFEGYFFLEPESSGTQSVSPSYNTIVSLMKLVQENAAIGKIEELLKRDATLSYKLLRYINSAGFGLSCEIQSFRHAVTMLGYQNLHRWLALLLVTAARRADAAAPVIAAITRGRLAELLGHGLFEAKDRDNLFIVGAFSLLHVILRMPKDKVTEQLALPEAVTDALLYYQGPYGPILQLTELTERLHQPEAAAQAADLALSLGVSLDSLNRAQIDAITWAETLTA